MQDAQSPPTTREVSPEGDEEDTWLELQIRAFLEASDEIDIEPESVEELMQILTKHHQSTDDDETSADNHRISLPSEEDGDGQDALEWTKQEGKQMLHHLKEHGMSSFVKEYAVDRAIAIPRLLEALGVNLCPELRTVGPQTLLYFLRVAMSHQLRMRDRLGHYNTIKDVIHLIEKSQRILVLTGAGISVSCGIPDFRSRDGLYALLKERPEYDLDDPQQMFDIQYFKENPAVFYSFASQIYPSNFRPSPCHCFIKCIEEKGKLLRNYTQNIDTLETRAGVKRVLQCHGSFATATCLQCTRQVPGTEIESDVMARRVPLCPICNISTPRQKRKQTKKQAKGQWDSDAEDESDTSEYPPGIMKPDITFFGEKLDDQFDHALVEDRDQVDLLIVIGTSLKVSPVAEILNHLPHSIPQASMIGLILINKTPIRHINPDIVLLGNADDIVLYLSTELGWEISQGADVASTAIKNPSILQENAKKRSFPALSGTPPTRAGNSHVWLFDGAEGGEWLAKIQKEHPKQDSVGAVSSADAVQHTEGSVPMNQGKQTREIKRQKIV